VCVRERKAGSSARLSLIALHAELRKQMSNITALPFYRLCVRSARTPPILFSLGIFLLLPSLIHMHSSLIFRHHSCRLLSLVVCVHVCKHWISFKIKKKKRGSKREENWSFGESMGRDLGWKESNVNFLITIHRYKMHWFSRCIYFVFSEQANIENTCRWCLKLLM